MPIPGLFSAFYWPGDGSVNSAPVVPGFEYQYPYWYDGSTLGMGLVLPNVPRRFRKKWIGLKKRLWRKLPTRLQAWFGVTKRIFSPGFPLAVEAVRWTATHPESRNMAQWSTHLAHRIGQDPYVHENVSRFLAAYDRMPGNLSRPDKSLLIELAWMARKNG